MPGSGSRMSGLRTIVSSHGLGQNTSCVLGRRPHPRKQSCHDPMGLGLSRDVPPLAMYLSFACPVLRWGRTSLLTCMGIRAEHLKMMRQVIVRYIGASRGRIGARNSSPGTNQMTCTYATLLVVEYDRRVSVIWL
jgi:hypothetical protein